MTAPPADDVRRAAAAVFDRPEFRPADDSGVAAAVTRWLRGVFGWLGGLMDGNPVLFWLLLVGCLVALVAMLALIAYQLRAAFAGGDGGRRQAAAAARRKLSDGYREEADRRATAGEFTEAVRFLFLALVYRLDERGRVDFRAAYTNREYLALVGGRLPARDSLRIIVDTLDDHWYGERPCGRPQYDECRAVYERLAAA